MWQHFWFESDIVAQAVRKAADWERVTQLYRAAYDRDIYQCRRDMYQPANNELLPNFGQRMEHRGNETLGEFFDRHNMPRT